jgi:hypothetical protein
MLAMLAILAMLAMESGYTSQSSAEPGLFAVCSIFRAVSRFARRFRFSSQGHIPQVADGLPRFELGRVL